MQLRCIADGDLCERWLAEFGTFIWNNEVSALEIADSEAGSVGIDKVADLAATIGENGCLILAIDELAIVDKEASGHAMTKRLLFEFLEFAESDGVNVRKARFLEKIGGLFWNWLCGRGQYGI